MNKQNLSRSIGLIEGLLHIKDMQDFNKEGLVGVLEEIKELLIELNLNYDK